MTTPPSGGAPQDPEQPQQPNPSSPAYPPPSYGQAQPSYGQAAPQYPAQPGTYPPPPYGQAPNRPYGPQQPYAAPPQPYGTGYPPPYGYAPAFPGPQRRNGLAVASMWTSIGGIMTCGLAGIVGLVLGIVALNQIKRDGTAGRGMAIAGIVVGACFVAFFALVIIGGVVDGFQDYDSNTGMSWGIDT